MIHSSKGTVSLSVRPWRECGRSMPWVQTLQQLGCPHRNITALIRKRMLGSVVLGANNQFSTATGPGSPPKTLQTRFSALVTWVTRGTSVVVVVVVVRSQRLKLPCLCCCWTAVCGHTRIRRHRTLQVTYLVHMLQFVACICPPVGQLCAFSSASLAGLTLPVAMHRHET